MSENKHIPIDRRFAQHSAKELKNPEHLTWQGSEFDFYSLGWSDLLSSRKTVILGEANCGKTHEFKQQVKDLEAQGKFAFFLRLELLHDNGIRDVLFPEEADSLDSWLEAPEIEAWFFLDAVDDLRLREGVFSIALGKLQKEIGRKAEFAHILISCRPADWKNHLDIDAIEQHFPIPEARTRPKLAEPEMDIPVNSIQQELSIPMEYPDEMENGEPTQDKKTNVLILLPLTREQTLEFAACWDADKAAVLEEEIEKLDCWQMFQTPADIIDGMARIRDFGQLGSLQDQISSGIDRKLRDRADKRSGLSLEKARHGAQRLALAMCLMKRQSLAIEKLPSDNGQLVVADILTDWPSAGHRELLRLGIFDYSGINAVRFHHRTTQEFLAAKCLENLKSKGLSIREIKQLLFREKFGERLVVPSMEAVASWFALWNDDVFAEIKERKPQLLFRQGLPASMPIQRRIEVLSQFVSSYRGDGWRGVGVSISDACRLGHECLNPVVRDLWSEAYSGHDTRELFLKLILFSPLNLCTDLACEAAFDVKLPLSHRICACRAVLRSGSDEERQKLSRSILDTKWPDELICSLIPDLYPRNLDVDAIVALARRTEDTPNSVQGPRYALHSLIGGEDLSIEQVRELRTALYNTVWRNRAVDYVAGHFRSDYSHFSDAILAGCSRDIDPVSSKVSEEWARSVAFASHFGELDDFIYVYNEKELINIQLRADIRLREAYFWATFSLTEQLNPNSEAFSLYIHLISHDSVLDGMTEADLPWLYRALEDVSHQNRRPIAFYFLRQFWQEAGDIEIADNVRSRISDLPGLIEELDAYLIPTSRPDQSNLNCTKFVESRKRKKNEQRAAWDAWCEKLKMNPELMLSEDEKENTIFNLYKWLNDDRQIGNSWCHWDAELIQEAISEEFLQLVRPVLADFWRQSEPKLWSERAADRRNSYLNSWLCTLMAVTSEADNPNWACNLTADEAKLATRIAIMLEFNGFASYLPDIERVHSDSVQEVMIGELSSQLSNMAESNDFPLIHDLKVFGTNLIKRRAAEFLAGKFDKWPSEMKHDIRNALRYSTELINEYGSKDAVEIATSQLKCRLDISMSDDDLVAWLQALVLFDIGTACRKILEITAELEDETRLSRAVTIFGLVFGDLHGSARRRDFSSLPDEERTDLLYKLVCRVYEVAPPSTDIPHESGYTPCVRDHAEEARERLFTLLINSEGEKTHSALKKLAEMENFSHMKDRLREIATEVAANRCEPEPMPIEAFRRFDQERNLIPTDNQSIHNVMLNRLKDYVHFVEESEFSNRDTLRVRLEVKQKFKI